MHDFLLVGIDFDRQQPHVRIAVVNFKRPDSRVTLGNATGVTGDAMFHDPSLGVEFWPR